MTYNFGKISAVLALSCFCASAHAIVLDWDTITWPAGTLANSFDIDPSQPGNDITITLSGATHRITTDPATGTQTPATTFSLEGGTSPVEAALHIAADLHTNDKITYTVTFSPQYLLGVLDVTFTLFDIDTETNADEIRNIYALAPDGTQIAPTITNLGSAVSLSGSGLSQLLVGTASSPNTGPGSGNGNATITFAGYISSFTFTQENTPGTPRLEQIALSDIAFVPETNPSLSALGICLAAMGLTIFQRTRQPRRAAKPSNE